jgi:hypothetical protein
VFRACISFSIDCAFAPLVWVHPPLLLCSSQPLPVFR